MKKRNSISTIVMLSVIILFAPGCSKNGDSIFLPDLSAQWTNKADSNNTFFFLPAKTNVNTSTFDGNENPGDGSAQIHFTGSFTNSKIQFTYDNSSGSKSGKTFTGTINNTSTVMNLNNADLGNLVLEKK